MITPHPAPLESHSGTPPWVLLCAISYTPRPGHSWVILHLTLALTQKGPALQQWDRIIGVWLRSVAITPCHLPTDCLSCLQVTIPVVEFAGLNRPQQYSPPRPWPGHPHSGPFVQLLCHSASHPWLPLLLFQGYNLCKGLGGSNSI